MLWTVGFSRQIPNRFWIALRGQLWSPHLTTATITVIITVYLKRKPLSVETILSAHTYTHAHAHTHTYTHTQTHTH